ncbi:hypothetical protein BGL48_11875 [Salinivibrio sp. SS3]|uniref:Holin of 3TMs, for gene-transfer release n=1 Tax=Salinivibrio phage SMHB1 TaxID=1897436 RepID=A0A1D9CA16_9CAUD|nr:3TM-type holin [Salinivibrio sp. BNH]YP_009786980.1 hypothetical protein HOR26_gp38 [Salinivibrio phage SMHB1]AOY11843.1 hypothetical protein [Salinivibrio phage SMHB1]ODP98275.1 hypothetical protein BGL48_11875 [Salinivibrio sp. BNH]
MWDNVKKIIGTAAPMIGTLIGGPAGTAVGGMVASALGVENTPDAIEQELKANPEALLKLKQLESEERVRLRELSVEQSKIESEERRNQLTQQHATMQAELASNDPYVRRWRPTFGYAMCVAWCLLFAGIAYALVASPEHAADMINAVVALTPLFSVALAVLGISIHKRSQDKQVAKGVKPLGAVGALKKVVKGG